MKICFLAGTLGCGGAERQLVYMLRALRRSGAETRLLCLTRNEFFESEIKDSGVAVEWVGASSNRLARLRAIVRNLIAEPADVLQSSHFYTNLYVALAGKILRRKSIGAIRGDLHHEIAANGRLGKYQLTLPAHLIANNELARNRALAKGVAASNIDFVRNAVDVVDARAEIARADASIVNVLFVGRLVELKRPELFIKIAAAVKSKLPNRKIRFRIAGDGELRGKLEALGRLLGLDSSDLIFLGARNDMNAIYGAADVLVLTSRHEGTPNVLLEAMAHRVSIVAANVGGVPEILNQTRGFLVQPDDENGFVEATAKLVLDKDLRREFAARGRAFVIENHSLEYLKQRLENIYSRLLARSQ